MLRIVPLTGGEKESLLAALERHRDVVVWKLEGLDHDQLRRVVTPSGNSMLGMVKHLAWVDEGWFCETFGKPTDLAEFDPLDPNADFRIEPHETTADIVATYERARAASNAVVEELEMDAIGTAWFGEPVSLRWVMIHMIEETARHAGHLDIMRELLDGETGDHQRD